MTIAAKAASFLGLSSKVKTKLKSKRVGAMGVRIVGHAAVARDAGHMGKMCPKPVTTKVGGRIPRPPPRAVQTAPRVDVPSFIAVLLAGLLAGSELTSRGVVHPTLWKLEHREQVRAEKLMYRRFASIDPFLMTATVIACFVAAGSLDGDSSKLALAAGLCFATMLAITLAGNMPLNLKVFGWDEEEGDPEEWRRIRRRWDRLHTVRVVLDLAGFVLIALAVTG